MRQEPDPRLRRQRGMKQILTCALIALAACGGGSTTLNLPADPDQVVLTVTSEGGFVPVEFNLDRMPQFQLMADGTLFFQGPIPEIFPGPLTPNVQQAELSDDQIGEILALVEELGLPEVTDEFDNRGAEMIADAGTTVFTYYDDAGEHRLAIYALGIAESPTRGRILAQELNEQLFEAGNNSPSAPYTPDRLQVAAGSPIGADPQFFTTQPWPLQIPFDEMPDWGVDWKCLEVTEGVDALYATFSQANSATLWEDSTGEKTLRARPLLPGEDACTGAPQGA
ncbi:hypothetical protein BH23PLA1_BH23PLA1_41980 [soil metagenome]